MRAIIALSSLASIGAAAAAAVPPTIVHVIADDDLGYNDPGFVNGGKTHTPNIDAALVNSGAPSSAAFAPGIARPALPTLGWRSWNWFAGDATQAVMELEWYGRKSHKARTLQWILRR